MIESLDPRYIRIYITFDTDLNRPFSKYNFDFRPQFSPSGKGNAQLSGLSLQNFLSKSHGCDHYRSEPRTLNITSKLYPTALLFAQEVYF